MLFFGVVGGYALVHPPGTPILPLLLLTPAVLVYLRRRAGLTRRNLVGLHGLRAELPGILAGCTLAAVLGVGIIAVVQPEKLLHLPRTQPLLWAAVVVGYPLLSVYPQELIFRGFLLHRYGGAFGRGGVAASAVAFGFAHVIYGNVFSVLLTAVGGWLFARRYQRTGLLMAASLEHALYGVLAFTIGLDHLFYDPGTGG